MQGKSLNNGRLFFKVGYNVERRRSGKTHESSKGHDSVRRYVYHVLANRALLQIINNLKTNTMSKERVQLDKNSKDLLEFSAGDLIPVLAKNKKLHHVKMSAFDYYNPETKEQYQVQVLVTRNENDFLGFLQTEEMSEYGS